MNIAERCYSEETQNTHSPSDDPEKLRRRVQWLRRREIELHSRVFGPRYRLPDVDNARFVGHIGPWDGYLVNEQCANGFVYLTCVQYSKQHSSMVLCRITRQSPEQYPLHYATLILAEQLASVAQANNSEVRFHA